jgi:hypothetical protein
MCNFWGRGGVCARLFTVGIWACTLLTLLLAAPGNLKAQDVSGTIVGTVTDSTGGAIPGATITAINKDTGAKLTQKAGASGEFTFSQLPVGTYEVHVAQGNFKEYVETGIQVHTSTNTEVSAVLSVGSFSEKITVQADAVQVQTTSAEVGEVVSGTQVRELPLNGENFVGLTQLSPGVSAAQGANFTQKGLDGGVNFSVNGNPYNMNLFLVDGVNNNDVGSGRTILVYPSVDTIAEFKMIRNSYGPEYGQAAGAIISITTRSGENQIHGGFFYSGRNDILDANDWVSNDTPNPVKAKERRSDYGYNASGPILKDKLFLWWNQEWNKEIHGASYSFCVPTVAEAQGDFSAFAGASTDQCGANIPKIPTVSQTPGNPLKIANPDAAGLLIAKFQPAPNEALTGGNNWTTQIPNHLNWSEWNVRADYQMTRSNRFTFRWTNDSWNNPSPNDPGAFWGESAFPTVNSSWAQPSKSVMAKWSSTISNTMVNDVEFGFGQNRIITTLGGTEASIVPALQTAYPDAWPTALKQKDEFFGTWGGLSPYGNYGTYSSYWNIAPYGNHEDLYTIQDNLSKVSGNHTFKAGIFISSNAKIESNGNGADRPSFPGGVDTTTPGTLGYLDNNASTGNPLANILLPGTGANPQTFSSVSENNIDGIAAVHWHDFEPYGADSWRFKKNLTINYGVRWSIFREPYGGTNGGNTNPAYNDGGNYPNQWANWSPAAYSAAEAAANPADACNGILTVPGTTPCANAVKTLSGLGVNLPLSNGTPGPNSSLVQQNLHAFAPRVGLAWDVHGDGKLAIRLGGGQFNQREEVGLAEGLARNAPFVILASANRSLDTAPSLANPQVSPSANKTTGGFLPNSWQWNATVEQEVARNTTIEIGYVGNTGLHLTSMTDANAIPQQNWLAAAFANGSAAENALRPAGNFGMIGSFARGGQESYHSLQAMFRSQMGPSTFQAAYTWSHSIGDVQLDNSSGSVNNQATTDRYNPGLDKGNTNINRPNIFVANEVLFLPKFANRGQLVQQTVGGWQFNSIFTAAQGSSLSVFTAGIGGATVTSPETGGIAAASTLNSLVGTGYNGNQRPLLVPSTGCGKRDGNVFLNLNHFSVVGYTIGSFPANMAPRGVCYGAPNTNMDGQLAKNWYIKEKYRIKFSMDFFNIFNHPNFNTSNLESAGYGPTAVYCGGASATSGLPCSPTNNVISANPAPGSNGQYVAPSFGTAGNVNNARELQYALKFSF